MSWFPKQVESIQVEISLSGPRIEKLPIDTFMRAEVSVGWEKRTMALCGVDPVETNQ